MIPQKISKKLIYLESYCTDVDINPKTLLKFVFYLSLKLSEITDNLYTCS